MGRINKTGNGPDGDARKPSQVELVKENLAEGAWEYVEKVELGPQGKSATGRRLFHGHRIRNGSTGKTLVVGSGEMKAYAGIDIPKCGGGQQDTLDPRWKNTIKLGFLL